MSKVRFDNMETDRDNLEKIDNIFESYLGDEIHYVSKEEYTHEEEGLGFKYKYVIVVIDMLEHTGEEGAFISLELVVSPESTHEDIKEEVRYSFGLEGTEYEVGHLDFKQHGLGVVMAYEELEEFDLEVVEEKLDTIATLLPMVDSFRGFKLDSAWNGIGTTGWDSIRHVLFNDNIFGF